MDRTMVHGGLVIGDGQRVTAYGSVMDTGHRGLGSTKQPSWL